MDLTTSEIFESIFYPESIAVVGISREGNKPGNAYLQNLIDGGFKGKLYGVGSVEDQISGVPVFASVSDIPEPVDFVIVSIPKEGILDLLDECGANGAKVLQVFTAGFTEADEAGHTLETQMVQKAREFSIRIIGPNCIGIGCPEHCMRLMWRPLRRENEPGTVGLLSQSGGNAGFFMEAGMMRGIRFSKVASFGNGADLNDLDFLEYFAADPKTQIIGAYLEDTTDGRRFLDLLREITLIKPVVILKGGLTDAGARIVSSHTASLGGSEAVWKAALSQVGAIRVNIPEEFADVLTTLYHLGRFEGNRAAILSGLVGAGGGACVAAADACAREGLKVPALAEQTIARLKVILPPAGSIYQNPVDVGAIAAFDLNTFLQAMEAVFADPGIDLVVLHLQASFVSATMGKPQFDEFTRIVINFRQTQSKPFIVLSQSPSAEIEERQFEERCSDHRIPTYTSFDRMARAIAKVVQYWRYRSEHESPTLT